MILGGIALRYEQAAAALADQCRMVGRDPAEVRLVAVSKTVGLEGVACALGAGARDFGENRPDQIVVKSSAFEQASWHFIGNIQSRRIPDIVRSSTLVHSLDNMSHAEKMGAVAKGLGKVQDVLVEVNVSGERSKGGIAPGEALTFVGECSRVPGLRVRGLMTMAPQGDRAVASACFASLRELAAHIRAELDPDPARCFTELSMGMSDDWREAVAQGSTLVRIGRAIFSDVFE